MQLKRCLLTPLLFAQMWVGAGVLPLKADTIQENTTTVTLRVAQAEVIATPKVDDKTVLAFCLFALLISIVCFGKKYFVRTKVTFKVQKEHVRQYFKSSFLNRSVSKSKNSYYWHFYSALNLVKST
jgi:hypothetical protein